MKSTQKHIVALFFFLSVPAFAGLQPGPPSIADLQKQSTLIVAANLTAIDDSQGFETVQLSVTRIIQGQPGTLTLRAEVPPSQLTMLGNEVPPKTGLVPRSVLGQRGIWFLKAVGSGWQVILLDNGSNEQVHTSLPVDTTLLAPAGTVSQQLLAYTVQWFQSLPYPSRIDQDFRLFGSFNGATPQDVMNAIRPLLASPRTDLYGVGLAIAIRLGSLDALSGVVTSGGMLRANPKLKHITDAIGTYFAPQGGAAIAPLQQIAELHSNVAGLDAAVGAALQKIGTKDVLPAMATLLDSTDPEAQLRAAWFFSYFATFADKNGNISGTGMAGPYDSPVVHQQMPSRNAAETPAQYAQFWRTWWSANRASFGF